MTVSQGEFEYAKEVAETISSAIEELETVFQDSIPGFKHDNKSEKIICDFRSQIKELIHHLGEEVE